MSHEPTITPSQVRNKLKLKARPTSKLANRKPLGSKRLTGNSVERPLTNSNYGPKRQYMDEIFGRNRSAMRQASQPMAMVLEESDSAHRRPKVA